MSLSGVWKALWIIWTGISAVAAFVVSVSPATAISNLSGWLRLLGWSDWANHLTAPLPVMAMRSLRAGPPEAPFSLDAYWREQDVFWLVVAIAVVAALIGVIVLLLSRRREAAA